VTGNISFEILVSQGGEYGDNYLLESEAVCTGTETTILPSKMLFERRKYMPSNPVRQ